MSLDFAIQAEEELLLLAYDTSPDATELGIRPTDFVVGGNRGLFTAWREAKKEGLANERSTFVMWVFEKFKSDPSIYEAARKLSLSDAAPGDEMARVVLRTVRDRIAKARAAKAVDRFKSALAEPFAQLDQETERLHNELLDLVERPQSTMVDDVAGIVHEEADAILSNKRLFYPTGLPEWDVRFGGLSNEGVTLLIGVSGHGKTTTLNRLYFGMSAGGFGVYLHGTETSREQRLRDIIYSAASVNQVEARTATQAQKEAAIRRLNLAGEMVAGFTGTVTGSGLELEEICANIRAGVMAGRIEVAMVDYLQDIPCPARFANAKMEWVGHCSQTLKDLSAELQIPILVGAQAQKPQLKEAKVNPRPGMFSVQWASKAAQDAEEVYTLYYNDAFKAEWGEAWNVIAIPGHIEIIKRKARRTKLGYVEVPFHGDIRWLGEKVSL